MRHFRRSWSCRVCGFVYLCRRDARAHWRRGHTAEGLPILPGVREAAP